MHKPGMGSSATARHECSCTCTHIPSGSTSRCLCDGSCRQSAALFHAAPGQLLPAEEGQAAAQQQADLASPASDAAAAVAEAPAEGAQHADALQQGGRLAAPPQVLTFKSHSRFSVSLPCWDFWFLELFRVVDVVAWTKSVSEGAGAAALHHICTTDSSVPLTAGAEAPGGELAEPHAQLHGLLEASDGGQPQPTPLQPASAPPEQPLLT